MHFTRTIAVATLALASTAAALPSPPMNQQAGVEAREEPQQLAAAESAHQLDARMIKAIKKKLSTNKLKNKEKEKEQPLPQGICVAENGSQVTLGNTHEQWATISCRRNGVHCGNCAEYRTRPIAGGPCTCNNLPAWRTDIVRGAQGQGREGGHAQNDDDWQNTFSK